MALMALDHVRDFIHVGAMSFLPTDLTRTTAGLFFTRWITHFCAPVFAFTAGIGAFLWLRRHSTKAQLSKFLLSRGLWLVFLELTVLRFIVFSSIRFNNTQIILVVLWMLGLCMMVLALLAYLPVRVLAVLSIGLIATHNLLDRLNSAQFGPMAWLWNILHQQGAFPVGTATVLVAYPLIPWVAVMAAGYCFGLVLEWEPERRQRFLVKLGLALTVSFIVLRAFNRYGDPAPWSVHGTPLLTVLSFLNCTKYPPSLAFLLMTLGPAIAAMGWLERIRWSDNHPIVVFGRVPFFYYVVHLSVIHLLAIVMGFLRYGGSSFLWFPPPSMGGPKQLFPHDYGWSLWTVYGVWLAVIGIAYPLCGWFSRLKQRRRDWWLSYL
jgi:uncharacterized membrane protein